MSTVVNFLTSSMGWSIIIFLVIYFFIATNKLDQTVSAFVGAFLVIALGLVSYERALSDVDVNVILLLIGMMVIVGILSETGIFEWLAIKIAKGTKGNAVLVVMLFLMLTAILSAFLDNVTTVILIVPITILLTQILEIPTAPILILEAIFSNIGGTATMIGDPPNIIIGSQTKFGFNDFLFNLAPVIIIIVIVVLIGLYFFMRKDLKTSPEARERVMAARPECAIIQPKVLKNALPIFVLVLLGFFTGSLTHIEPGIVAMTGAVVMTVTCKVSLERVLHHVEWNTIMFFIGLFMLMSALSANGVFDKLGQLVLWASQGDLFITVMAMLWISAILSMIVNNIPLIIAMIPLAQGMVPVFAAQMGLTAEADIMQQIEAPLIWALALGSCLGGNGTMVGASANVVVAQIATRNGSPVDFMRFTKYGLPLTLVSLVVCTIYMWLRYF